MQREISVAFLHFSLKGFSHPNKNNGDYDYFKQLE